MTREELDRAYRFFHEIWTDAAYERFPIKGRYYDLKMKREFGLLDYLLHRGMREAERQGVD